MKDITCNICNKRNDCQELCKSMLNKLSAYKSYSEHTFKHYNIPQEDIDSISIYSYGLSDVESRDVKRIVIAILTKDQIELLKLYSEGYTQKEIGEKLNVTQSSISQKLGAIKRELRNSVVQMLPYVV